MSGQNLWRTGPVADSEVIRNCEKIAHFQSLFFYSLFLFFYCVAVSLLQVKTGKL